MAVVPMADQERCPIFPSMLRAYCSHCQGTARGTAGNPKFSLKESTYNGFPVVEVLRDGAAIHPWDEHFRFGRRKAEMLVVCINVLREFWKTNGDKNDRFVPQVIENRAHRLRVRVFVEKHPDFERSDGELVERSWLRLQALPPDDEHIGLGAMKCRAISELEEELRSWLARCEGVR
jgi:hypothetical protein